MKRSLEYVRDALINPSVLQCFCTPGFHYIDWNVLARNVVRPVGYVPADVRTVRVAGFDAPPVTGSAVPLVVGKTQLTTIGPPELPSKVLEVVSQLLWYWIVGRIGDIAQVGTCPIRVRTKLR